MRLPPFKEFTDSRTNDVLFDLRWYAGEDFNEAISAALTPKQYKVVARMTSLMVTCFFREYHNWLCEQLKKEDQG